MCDNSKSAIHVETFWEGATLRFGAKMLCSRATPCVSRRLHACTTTARSSRTHGRDFVGFRTLQSASRAPPGTRLTTTDVSTNETGDVSEEKNAFSISQSAWQPTLCTDLGRSAHKAAQRSRTSMKVDDPAGTTIDNSVTKRPARLRCPCSIQIRADVTHEVAQVR